MALDNTWQIGVQGGAMQTAAALGISNLTRRRTSQGTDTASFTVGGRNVDAAALFAYASTVMVRRNGTPWFAGRVTKVPGTGDGSRQDQSYELSGPWWYLDHLVCRQQWKIQGATATALLGRLILGQGLDGSHILTGAVITEAVQYAINAGAPFQLGSILAGFAIPFDEVKDVTCAEVVRKMLRWHPDAVTWFDYSVSPPALNIEARANLAAATVTMGAAPLVAIGEITARHELQAPSVVIHYEITNTSNGHAQTDVATDAAPAGATGAEFGGVVLTIPLRGVTAATVQQPVQVVPIVDETTDPGLVAFLTSMYGGELATATADPSITADGITITACSRGLADSADQKYNPATGEFNADPSYDDSLANELVQGSITPWMIEQFAIKAQRQRIIFKYTLDSGSGDGDGPGGADYQGVSDEKTGTYDFIATNAVTQVYTSLTNFDAGDPVPAGLAASYLTALDVLQWSGSVTLEEAVAGVTLPGATLGRLLNIGGSANAAWAAMAAVIVQEEVRADVGRTVLTFGPTPHLTPQDLVERLKTTRPGGLGGREGSGAQGTASSDTRATGAPGDKNSVAFGVHHPIQNAVPVPGGGGGNLLWWNVTANGQSAVAQFASTTPVPTPPAGTTTQNPT